MTLNESQISLLKRIFYCEATASFATTATLSREGYACLCSIPRYERLLHSDKFDRNGDHVVELTRATYDFLNRQEGNL